MAGQAIGDVPQLAVDRRRIADDADAAAVERRGCEQPFAAQNHRHCTIIEGRALASGRQPLIDYAPLVVSPACFARPESRSSLMSRSLPAIVQPTCSHLVW